MKLGAAPAVMNALAGNGPGWVRRRGPSGFCAGRMVRRVFTDKGSPGWLVAPPPAPRRL